MQRKERGFVVNGVLIDFFCLGYREHFYNCISSQKEDL
jgi:hypothetical protein